MPAYRVTTPDEVEDGITVECDAHGESETFPPDQRTVAFRCPDCETEVGIEIDRAGDWRALTERC